MATGTVFMIWSCMVLTGVLAQRPTATEIDTNGSDLDIFQELRSIRDDLSVERKSRETMMAEQGQLITELYATVELQKHHISELEIKLLRQEDNLDDLKNDGYGKVSEPFGNTNKQVLEEKAVKSEPVARNRFTALGCVTDTITLACSNDRTITVTSANYGMYYYSCSSCCPPSPSADCVELVSENRPSDWAALKALCDNQTSCQYQYDGAVIDECEPGYVADYMQIFYDCLPEDIDEPVGFTAHATDTRTYAINETVVFDDVQSNFGGHYNYQTCSFHCAHHGIYFLSVNFNAFHSGNMYMEIVRDGIVLASVMCDDVTDGALFPHASALVIVECDVGQVVWARAGITSGYLYGYLKYTQFSGYLLHRFA